MGPRAGMNGHKMSGEVELMDKYACMSAETLCKGKHSSHGLPSSQQWLYNSEFTYFFFYKRLLDIWISCLQTFLWRCLIEYVCKNTLS